MLNSSIRFQNGQSMTEFLVALTVFAPLMLGIIYVEKYSDIKHQAIQASRYAAFERALDPSLHETPGATGVLAEETRARFFTDGSRNSGNIGYQDSTAGLTTSATLNPLWGEVNGTAMVTNYSDVSVDVTQGSINANGLGSAGLSTVDTAASKFFNLNTGGQVQANVEVAVADITHFAPLANLNLKIGATTVVAGDAWNADGATDVANHFTVLAIPVSALKVLTVPLDPVFQLFSSTPGPQWGCVNPDAVPKDHLSQYNAPAPCSD